MKNKTAGVELSVVISVCDEERVLAKLFDHLYPVLDGLGIAYEVVFVDAGSRDRSATLLRQQYKLRPDVTRVLLLRGNTDPHGAIMAGFDVSGGGRVVTLGADQWDLPAAIPRLLAEMDRGHDYVGSFRRHRDSGWRASVSKAINRLSERITRLRMTDPGCMLRAYDREIVNAILTSGEAHTFTPALAYRYAADPTEIEVEQTRQAEGGSRYPLYESTRLNFDLMAGLSRVPLQLFSLVGMGVSLTSFVLAVLLAVRRLVIGPEVEGVYTLFAVLFFLASVILFGMGLLGGYLKHLCEQSRSRPSAPVREYLRPRSGPAES